MYKAQEQGRPVSLEEIEESMKEAKEKGIGITDISGFPEE
jgi:hypothetical protein